jgi:hypothetical protein
MYFEVLCLSTASGAIIGYCYGILFCRRLQTFKQTVGRKKASIALFIALQFILNYVLLAAALVLLLKYFTLNAPLFLVALLLAFFGRIYQLMRRPK